MNRIFENLRPFIRWVTRHPVVVLAGAGLLTVVGVLLAMNLRVDTDFSKLIPSDYPSVQAIERLRDEVGGESPVDVIIESPSFEANLEFAEALIPQALALRNGGDEPYLNRVDFQRDTEFLENNALYFATPAELDSLEVFLRNTMEEARLEVNPFFFDIEDDFDDFEDEADVPEDSETLANLEEAYQSIVGKEYPISDDSTVMVLRFYPTGSQTNLDFIDNLYDEVDGLITSLGPTDFHPEMEVEAAGRLLRQLVEVRTITDDVINSFGAGISTVLLVVVLYFSYKAYRARAGRRFDRRVLLSRLAGAPIMAILIGAPLFMSLTWTFGLAYLAFSTLNLMTSALGLVLFGLGIDFGIHFYARFSEERGNGKPLEEAIEVVFTSTGQAITVGGLTTAAALFVLTMAHFKGFSEFGFIAGTGIVFALLAMMIVLPALLILFERMHLLNFEARTSLDSGSPKSAGRYPGARGVAIVSIGLVVAAIALMPRLGFEYDFGALEPEYEEFNEVNRKSRLVYSSSRRNPAYILVDSPEEALAVKDALLEHAATDTLTPTIGDVETLLDRFPLSVEGKQQKLARLADVRELLQDPLLQAQPSADLMRLERAAQTREPMEIEDVPESLRNLFVSKSGELGNFVMVYPLVGLSDGRNSMAFADDVGTVVTADGNVYHAGSTSLVAADMLSLMMDEAPWMALATLVVVVTLMWIHFRSWKWTLLALIPLGIGLIWMMLVMEIMNLAVNFYNLVVLSAVLGLGNDAGVHIVHRYREEGRGSIINVLRSTGEHVVMASLTTMIGFGGLLLSFHPGLHSIGSLAVAGMGTTLLAALTFLPALIQWWEDRRTPETDVRLPDDNGGGLQAGADAVHGIEHV